MTFGLRFAGPGVARMMGEANGGQDIVATEDLLKLQLDVARNNLWKVCSLNHEP